LNQTNGKTDQPATDDLKSDRTQHLQANAGDSSFD
jgi:hypothetical protein